MNHMTAVPSSQTTARNGAITSSATAALATDTRSPADFSARATMMSAEANLIAAGIGFTVVVDTLPVPTEIARPAA